MIICVRCGGNIAGGDEYARTNRGFHHLDCYVLPEIGVSVSSATLKIKKLTTKIQRLIKRNKEAARLLECYFEVKCGLPQPKGHSEAVRKWLKGKQ